MAKGLQLAQNVLIPAKKKQVDGDQATVTLTRMKINGEPNAFPVQVRFYVITLLEISKYNEVEMINLLSY